MDVPRQARIFPHQRARGAGVIEMDVREENRVEIADGNPLRGKAGAEGRQRGLGAGVDHGQCGGAAQQTGSDGLRPAEKIYVNRDCVRSEIFHVQTALINRSVRGPARSNTPQWKGEKRTGAAGRSRTDNGENPQRILSPPRMPISPQPHRATRQPQLTTPGKPVQSCFWRDSATADCSAELSLAPCAVR